MSVSDQNSNMTFLRNEFSKNFGDLLTMTYFAEMTHIHDQTKNIILILGPKCSVPATSILCHWQKIGSKTKTAGSKSAKIENRAHRREWRFQRKFFRRVRNRDFTANGRPDQYQVRSGLSRSRSSELRGFRERDWQKTCSKVKNI